jgi:hypothetical protein
LSGLGQYYTNILTEIAIFSGNWRFLLGIASLHGFFPNNHRLSRLFHKQAQAFWSVPPTKKREEEEFAVDAIVAKYA